MTRAPSYIEVIGLMYGWKKKPDGNEIQTKLRLDSRISLKHTEESKRRILILKSNFTWRTGSGYSTTQSQQPKKHQWQSKYGLANVPENVPSLSFVSAPCCLSLSSLFSFSRKISVFSACLSRMSPSKLSETHLSATRNPYPLQLLSASLKNHLLSKYLQPAPKKHPFCQLPHSLIRSSSEKIRNQITTPLHSLTTCSF